MAAVGTPQSLAESLGVERDAKVTYTTACCLVAGLAKTQKLSAPEVFDRAVGATNPLDLPMKQFDSRAAKVVHMVDVIKDYEGDIDKEAVKDLMLQNNLADLPTPLCPKAECVIPFTMDVCIIPAPDGKRDIYKHFVFDSPIKVSLAKELMHGETLLIDWGANQKAGPKAFLYVPLALPGRLPGQPLDFPEGGHREERQDPQRHRCRVRPHGHGAHHPQEQHAGPLDHEGDQ